MKTDILWLRTRQQLLMRLKAQVALRLGPSSKELLAYARSFQTQYPKRWQPSTKAVLLDRMAQAQVVFAGDFHAYSQSQRVHLRLLRHLVQERTVTLHCEFLEMRHQSQVDQLQAGKLSEAKFLQLTRWTERWGFPWEAYRVLLAFAREHGMEVVALNQVGSHLKKRDRLAAHLIVQHLKKKPDDLHYVIFGELHLASGHLPEEVRRKYPVKKAVSVFQDEEVLYFRLARKGLENQVEVMRASDDRFCVLGSPPWVKWQSYAMYLEQAFDQDLGDEGEPLDLSDQFKSTVELIGRDLGVRCESDQVSVYSSRQPQMWRDLRKRLTPEDLKVAQFLVQTDCSFYIPQGQVAYVARPSVNHLADVAGRFVHSTLEGGHEMPVRMPRGFEALIWIEAVGFFASKLINHRRAADTLTDLQSQLGSSKQNHEVLALALDQRTREVLAVRSLRRRRVFKPKRKTSYLQAARLLGAMMGERLYQSHRRGWVKRDLIRSWLKENIAGPGFARTYLDIVRKLEPGEALSKSREERL